MQRCHIGSKRPNTSRIAALTKKKPCSRGGTGPDRMEESYRRVDACRPITTANKTKLLLLELLLHHSRVLRLRQHLAAKPPADSRAGCLDCALFALLRLPTALLPCRVLQPRQLPSTVRFKTTRGKSASMGSVTCRSMENSLCEHGRRQLREARGIGRSVWRIGVTGRFLQMWGGKKRRAPPCGRTSAVAAIPPANLSRAASSVRPVC